MKQLHRLDDLPDTLDPDDRVVAVMLPGRIDLWYLKDSDDPRELDRVRYAPYYEQRRQVILSALGVWDAGLGAWV